MLQFKGKQHKGAGDLGVFHCDFVLADMFIHSVGFIALRGFLIKLPLQQFLNANHHEDLKHGCSQPLLLNFKEFLTTHSQLLSLCPAFSPPGLLSVCMLLIHMYVLQLPDSVCV